MAASMCDVFSFCVGVAGGARGSVEVRFVSSAKVRPGRTPFGEPRRGPMPTFWSPGRSAPVWFLLGPRVQGLSSCPGSWRYHAGEAQCTHSSRRNPGTLTGGLAAAVLDGVEALGGPGVEEYPGSD